MNAVVKLQPTEQNEIKAVHSNAIADSDSNNDHNSLLRFITCGSVDDGKSTLIGRLLYETGSIYEDQEQSLVQDSKKFGTTGDVDYALLVDGLSAEREQGITIDVAYRYFSSNHRSFIIADTPGHEQYTRNMATGASQADLAIILVDARKGVLPQTRRHAFITSMVGISSVVVAINKMDLVNYDEQVFNTIVAEFTSLLPKLAFEKVRFIPISAKLGDNLVQKSEKLAWYNGQSLLDYLNNVTITANIDNGAFRMPVQWVNRPNLDFRGFSGTVAHGEIAVGQKILSLPSGESATIKAIYNPDGAVEKAYKDEAITITLNNEIDVSRGDVLVAVNDDSRGCKAILAKILWLSNAALSHDKRLLMRIGTASTPVKLGALDCKIDIHSYDHLPSQSLSMNEIGIINIEIEKPIVARSYEDDNTLGAFILIDPYNNETLALGTVETVTHSEEKQNISEIITKKPVLYNLYDFWLNQQLKIKKPQEIILGRLLMAAILAILCFALSFNFIASLGLFVLDIIFRPFIANLCHKSKIKKIEQLQDGAGI